jgi:hypothetical protein
VNSRVAAALHSGCALHPCTGLLVAAAESSSGPGQCAGSTIEDVSIDLSGLSRSRANSSLQLKPDALLSPHYVLQHGDALMIEAYQSLVRKHKFSNHFSLVREVPDSAPPRTAQLMDRYERGATAAGIVTLQLDLLTCVTLRSPPLSRGNFTHQRALWLRHVVYSGSA